MEVEVIKPNLKIELTVTAIIFPRDHEHQSGEFAIFTALIKEEDSSGTRFSATLRGNVPSLTCSQTYNAIVDFVKDPKYGNQYIVKRMNSKVDWSNKARVKRYLSRIIAGSYVDKLYEKFENPIDVLRARDVDSLMEINGIGESVANRIIDKFFDSQDSAMAIADLSSLGLTNAAISKLVERYRSADVAVDKVYNHPYDLIREVRGFGWNKADALAQRAGIVPDSPDRIKAFFYYFLDTLSTTNGSTFASLRAVFDATKALCELISEEKLKKCLTEMVDENILIYHEESQRIGLKKNFEVEENIAKELIRLLTTKPRPVSYVENSIERCEEKVGYQYSEEQVNAVHLIINNSVSLLTALGGAGKSATMYPVVRAMLDNGYSVAQCCLSGRAALNLTEATGILGTTIHKLLGLGMFDGKMNAKYNKNHQLPVDMVILDEVSMVGGEIFLQLLEAIPTGARLVMVGDFGQLEPIGFGNVGNDISKTGVVPHAKLTKIFRQAQQSGIISESRRVYAKEQIVKSDCLGSQIRGELQDFKITCNKDTQGCYKDIIDEYKRFVFDLGIPPNEIAVCVAKRALGPLSARLINDTIQSILPVSQNAKSISINYIDGEAAFSEIIREGDRITITENNYQVKDVRGESCPIFNGNVGNVIQIDEDNGKIIVDINRNHIVIPRSCWKIIRLGYAITTHKAQGIGVPYVIAVCDPSARTLLSKEFLYTQITRAKKFCTLIGTAESIRYATSMTHVMTKSTWLTELILNEYAKNSSTILTN